MKFFQILLFSFCLTAHASIPKTLAGKSLNSMSLPQWNFSEAKVATVVVFLSATCPCSDSHVPYLKKLRAEFPQVDFIGVHSNMDEDLKTSGDYFSTIGLPFAVIQDEKAKLADEFEAYKTPHAYVISPAGKILYQGGVTSSATALKADKFFVRDALNDVLNGKEVKVAQGRTLGCVIARE